MAAGTAAIPGKKDAALGETPALAGADR